MVDGIPMLYPRTLPLSNKPMRLRPTETQDDFRAGSQFQFSIDAAHLKVHRHGACEILYTPAHHIKSTTTRQEP